ncbi:protealysin inhibitor emfourin [Agrococcus sp. TF02-05]|uniref:protealysin inhibitor emfourin n=1 Tax=Agrococcus sp. TF02-05 TaxID=2815211 RepID=UPI001AA12013|nr:protealysin inhibitor emfourin [Agrococcus sp. TF02-05]MBO1768657.1 M4 family metallopeptidase [Agrococcus sp. TF02-05]
MGIDGRGFAERVGALGATTVRRAERGIHRLARPATFALAPLLLRQAKQLQSALVWLPEPQGRRWGTVGEARGGEPLRLLLVGDSTATGVGADRLEDALAVRLAEQLAALADRSVEWRIEGQEGSTSAAVLERHLAVLDRQAHEPWDVILVLVGANDALQLASRRAFTATVRTLLEGLRRHLRPGGLIGVAGAPQIDTFAWLPQPIRSLLGGHARSLDDALQRLAAAAPDVVHLPTPAILEPQWHASDGFHPSGAGYALWAGLIAPGLHEALGARSPSQLAGRRGIVPPYLLERLAAADLPAARVAAQTLGVDREVRVERAVGPRRRGLGAPAPARVPGEPSPDRIISDARGTTTLPGDEVRTEGAPPTGDAAADEAYDGLGASWRLLLEAFGRDSLDGRGMPLRATVHYGERYDNAFWDGERMVFGDGDGEVFAGFTGAIDVIGHELGHGVIAATADLVYRDQPGALNESIADVLGSLVKQHSLGQDAEEADWLIGAGVFTDRVQGVALRSMAAPGTAFDDPVLGEDPQPGHMRDFVVTRDDLGGVHINSGIPNRAFHLVATTIGGPAWEAPGQIWFDALTGGLDREADFAAFARATEAAAEARFGADARETEAVRSAWRAVGVTGDAEPDAPVEDAVRVARTGGMLGRTRAATLELEIIPGDDRERLDTLVASGVLAELDGRVLPDAPLWRVTIETRCDVTVAEPLLPDEVLALFRRLLELDER